MAFINTFGGSGFTQGANGELTPYKAPTLNTGTPSAGPQLNEQANMYGGFDAGSQSMNAASNGINQALNFVNNLNPAVSTSQPSANQSSWLPQNPYQSNPTGTDILGNTSSLNPRNFATLDAANSLAKQLGGNVVATNYEDGMRSPEYNIDFGRGSALNAAQLLARYNTNDPTRDKFWDSEYWRNKALEDELRYNSSPMEDQIRNDRSGQMGQIYKDVPGGYQSFAPGGSAGSFSDASHWKTTGPVGQTFAPGGSNTNLEINGVPGPTPNQFFGNGGNNPYAGTGGPTPAPPVNTGGGNGNQTQNLMRLFGMNPNMNSLYYLNQRPNNQYGGLGTMGSGGQFSPFGMAGFGGFGNQMPFTMGGMPGFMGQAGGMFGGGMQNPLMSQGGGFGQLLQLLSMLGIG